MKIVLFRHAEKLTDGSANPKLSPQGQQQALKLAKEVASKKIPTPQIMMTSPKTRAQQTFEHVSRDTGIKLSVTPLLNERQPEESTADFRRRIQEFLVLLQMDYQNNECIYLCTHFDWIEEFLTVVECTTDLLQSRFHQWGSGQWMWLDKADLWNLVKFDQLRI